VRIASYLLPLSIFEFRNTESVDEVFRRINSGGRKLSRQELRAAGATGHFAQAVRRIAAKVRGDDSHSDILRLNDMKNISITNNRLQYGINVDEMFWVKEGILTRDQVRESRDEELIADIAAFMVSDDPISSRAEFLDDFFAPGEDEASGARYASIELATQKRNTDLVISDFQRVLDQIMLTLAAAEETFGHLLFSSPPARAPRYFQAVFLAFYKLIILDSQEIKNRTALISLMRNSGSSMNVGDGGGRWGADQRKRTVDSVEGMYRSAFGPSTSIDPAQIHWITQLQNLLSQSRTEQSAYDFKQGFLNLAVKPKFDEGSFIKILQTCVAIANIRRGYKGYVIVGVAETASTSQRVE
jgi:hypothetical protein